ncbi:uncharacterized protein LOC143610241 [Bidens hawaiensis]|uniref:uncharacterized protein LOC143610241 n=1 Tax=Bidens hawaiensis TaxID=980011 RepID=UPI00404B1CAC
MAGEEKRPIIQPKASEGISLQVPKLNGTNYITWAMVVEAILDDQELWEVVQPEEDAVIDVKKNKTARSFLFQVVDGDILLQISQYKNAQDIWTALKARLGHVFKQDVLVKKLLDAVPKKYFQLVASIVQSVDLDSLMFEDAIGRLKAFEECLRGRERASNSQGKGWPSSQGRGRGRETGGQDRDDEDQDGCKNRDGQDRGSRQSGQRRTNDRQRGRKDRSQVQCYRCDEFGHFAALCPERDQKTVLLNEDSVIPKRFKTEPMEKDVRYLDNGASNHMTGNKAYFYELNE